MEMPRALERVNKLFQTLTDAESESVVAGVKQKFKNVLDKNVGFRVMCELWPSGIEIQKVLLIVMDQAPYMLSATNQLKPLFPNTCLEEQGLEKEKQWDILTSVGEQLDGFAKEKSESSIQKILDVKECVTSIQLPFQVNTKFAPLVSVDVERSFSIYKDILPPNRSRLIFQDIEMLNVLKYNFMFFPSSDE
ncbi:hypothetical protein C0J52_03104 [Blattella germanica]|nr:hypothetical protein C0J52_03104 [Blattella germanica]